MLTLALLTTLTAGPQTFVRHALLRSPTDGKPFGALEQAPAVLESFRSDTAGALHFTGKRVAVDAQVDLADEATEVELRVPAALDAEDAKGFRVQVHPGAALPLVGVHQERWVVGFLPEHDLPSPTLEVPTRPAATKLERGGPLDCPVDRLHVRPALDATAWQPASFVWSLERLGAPKDGWTRVAAVQPSLKLTVLAYVHASELRCGQGTGGGFLGGSGLGGASDGQVRARSIVLPAGTALFTAADTGTPVVRLLQAAEGLELSDGTVRLTLRDGAASLSLHGLVVGPGGAKGRGAFVPHGVGSTFARTPWPRLNAAPAP